MLKKLPFVALPNSATALKSPPPDGVYGVISYDDTPQVTCYHFVVERVFKWNITIYKFEDGLCDMISSSSSPGHLLTRISVDGLYIVDVPQHKRAELDKNLAGHNFVLEEQILAA